MIAKDSLIIALDFPELAPARELARVLAPEVGMLKVGLELFNSEGPRAIRELREIGAKISTTPSSATFPIPWPAPRPPRGGWEWRC